jgi:hypothetical protein
MCTRTRRLWTVNEIKIQIIDHNLHDDVASKVLWKILDSYVEDGKPVDVELLLKGRYDISRKFVVKLHGSAKHKDVVLIRSI